jgi:hypothetical protein
VVLAAYRYRRPRLALDGSTLRIIGGLSPQKTGFKLRSVCGICGGHGGRLRRVGGQRHNPAALPARKRPGIRRTGGWVGLRARLDGCRKSLLPLYLPHRRFNPGPSSPRGVAVPTGLLHFCQEDTRPCV